MFSHFGARLGDLNHLPSLALHFPGRFQASATAATDGGGMGHDDIRIVDQHPRDAPLRVPGLATALFAAAFAQAALLPPLGRPITGWRLVAVVAVLVKAGFQFRHPRGQPLRLLGQISLGGQQLLDQSDNGIPASAIGR